MRHPCSACRFVVWTVRLKFRHSFLLHAVLGVSVLAGMPFVSFSPAAQPLSDTTFSLRVSADPAVPAAAIAPPPGEYLFPAGDIVLLHAWGGGTPLGWFGDAAGSASVVPVTLDTAKTVMAKPVETAQPGADTAVFTAPADHRVHAFLSSGRLCGWFSADRTRPNRGAGITHLVSADYPGVPVFMQPNLNFEHIMNGVAADNARAQNTPRTDAVEIRCLSAHAVEAHWPAATSTWKTDCTVRYAFTGEDAIDIAFEVTPRADEAPMGYLVFMFASYIASARERAIHFPGTRDGVPGWVSFAGTREESGTVAGAGQPELSWESEALWVNLSTRPDVAFSEPVYYGLMDGDRNPETTDDTMALIMMFDDARSTRFAVWNWGDNPQYSAWDWQFVIRNPEVGRTYTQRARMVYRRFAGEQDVLDRYHAWRDALAANRGGEALPRAAFPVLYAPGDDGFNLLHLAERAVVVDRTKALSDFRRLLGMPLYELPAAASVDALLADSDSPQGRRAFWEAAAAQYPGSATVQYRLGRAREDSDDRGGAEAAYREALRIAPEGQRARIALAGLVLASGDPATGLRLVDEAVTAAPDLSDAAAERCAAAGAARGAAGDPASAVTLLRRAASLAPSDLRIGVALGDALAASGSVEEARAQFRSVLGQVPDSPYSAGQLDLLCRRGGGAAAAAAEWDAIVNLHPEAALPRLFLGRALEDAGDTVRAEQACREALRLRPEWREPKIALGALLAGRGDVTGGLELVDGAVAEAPDLSAAAAEAYARAARARVAAGDAAAAVALLRRASALAASDLRYTVALGDALDASGDAMAARAQFRAVLDQVPESPYSAARLDALCRRRNSSADCVGEWGALVKAHPESSLARMYLGRALQDAGDVAGAEAAYREASRLRPEWLEPKIQLGALTAAAGNVEHGLELVDEAVATADGLSAAAAEACARAARTRLTAGDTAAAVALLRRASALAAADLRYRMLLGDALEAAGDPEGAKAQFRAILEQVPQSPHSGARLYALCHDGKAPADCAGEWSRLVEAHPDAPLPRFYLGCVLEDSGDTKGAETAYREALRLSPDEAEPEMRLGALLAARGEVAEGIVLVDASVARNPDLGGPAAERCDGAAKTRLAEGDAASAAVLLRKARALSPTDLRYRVALGGVLETLGEDEAALAEYTAVVEAVPESPKSSGRIDAILERRGEVAGRVALWRGMVEKHPDAALPRLHLGRALELAGDANGAETAFREALARDASLEDDSVLFRRVRANLRGAP